MVKNAAVWRLQSPRVGGVENYRLSQRECGANFDVGAKTSWQQHDEDVGVAYPGDFLERNFSEPLGCGGIERSPSVSALPTVSLQFGRQRIRFIAAVFSGGEVEVLGHGRRSV